MQGNVGKGTEIFGFFGEFFKFLGKYYVPENTEEYWDEVIAESGQLVSKYEKCDFYRFAKGIVILYVTWLEDKLKHRNEDFQISHTEKR